MSGKYKEGDKVGYLTLIKDTGHRKPNSGAVYWLCECVCGKRLIRCTDSFGQTLRLGQTISCGCKKSKWIGKGLAFDPVRMERAREAIFPIEGTTLQGISKQKLQKNNKTGVRGVVYREREHKWYARLTFKRKEYSKGFETKAEAVAYRHYLEELFYEPMKQKVKELKEGGAK